MNRRFFGILLLALWGHSAELSAKEIQVDPIFVPMQRLGPVTQDTTLAQLKSLFGDKQVKLEEIPGPEGDGSFQGARVFKGTKREFLVRFDDTVKPMKVEYVWAIGSYWQSVDGISTKSRVAELQKLNGKPFTISGFGWDFAGFCNFGGGKVTEEISIYYGTKSQKLPDDFYGDVEIRSDDARLPKVKPYINRIGIPLKSWED